MNKTNINAEPMRSLLRARRGVLDAHLGNCHLRQSTIILSLGTTFDRNHHATSVAPPASTKFVATLFAAGWSSCYLSAIRLVAADMNDFYRAITGHRNTENFLRSRVCDHLD